MLSFRRIRFGKGGFTLVELMVVAIIVAILAAVAVPLLSGSKNRAYGTEAEAALGNVRSMLRVYFAEHRDYLIGPPNHTTAVTNVAVEGNVPGISAGDLTGTYFSSPNYTITTTAANTYDVTCTWNILTNTAPQAGKVNTIVATTTLDEDGVFTRTGY